MAGHLGDQHARCHLAVAGAVHRHLQQHLVPCRAAQPGLFGNRLARGEIGQRHGARQGLDRPRGKARVTPQPGHDKGDAREAGRGGDRRGPRINIRRAGTIMTDAGQRAVWSRRAQARIRRGGQADPPVARQDQDIAWHNLHAVAEVCQQRGRANGARDGRGRLLGADRPWQIGHADAPLTRHVVACTWRSDAIVGDLDEGDQAGGDQGHAAQCKAAPWNIVQGTRAQLVRAGYIVRQRVEIDPGHEALTRQKPGRSRSPVAFENESKSPAQRHDGADRAQSKANVCLTNSYFVVITQRQLADFSGVLPTSLACAFV